RRRRPARSTRRDLRDCGGREHSLVAGEGGIPVARAADALPPPLGLRPPHSRLRRDLGCETRGRRPPDANLGRPPGRRPVPRRLRREGRALMAELLGLLLVNACFLAAGAGTTALCGWWRGARALGRSLGVAYLAGLATFGVLAQLLYVLGASMSR